MSGLGRHLLDVALWHNGVCWLNLYEHHYWQGRGTGFAPTTVNVDALHYGMNDQTTSLRWT